jgi:membrane-associated protein
MNIISQGIDIILHLDRYLGYIATTYGLWTYLIVFMIIFMETGFVVTFFFPGDSLIFTAGTMAGMGWFNIWILFVIFSIAAILGDTVNYWIGFHLGPKVFREKSRFLNKKHLDETRKFFKKYGSETIILARFMPIVRTFTPLVAGIGKMDYWKFLLYNIIGGIGWVALFVWGGYFFGNLAWVQNHFTLVILIIIFASFIPPIYQYVRGRFKKKVIKNNILMIKRK